MMTGMSLAARTAALYAKRLPAGVAKAQAHWEIGRTVIRAHDEHKMSWKAIGDHIGTSREQARQIYLRACRRHKRSPPIKLYLNEVYDLVTLNFSPKPKPHRLHWHQQITLFCMKYRHDQRAIFITGEPLIFVDVHPNIIGLVISAHALFASQLQRRGLIIPTTDKHVYHLTTAGYAIVETFEDDITKIIDFSSPDNRYIKT